jgi:hypothetical protein
MLTKLERFKLQKDQVESGLTKSLNLKEDILAGNASVKRMVKIMVEVDPNSSESSWSVRIEGKVQENGLD